MGYCIINSGDSRIKKVGGHCGAENKVGGGQHKCLSCMVIFYCFEDKEFLGNVFTIFIFEKLFSHEALVTGRVTAASNNKTQLCK